MQKSWRQQVEAAYVVYWVLVQRLGLGMSGVDMDADGEVTVNAEAARKAAIDGLLETSCMVVVVRVVVVPTLTVNPEQDQLFWAAVVRAMVEAPHAGVVASYELL